MRVCQTPPAIPALVARRGTACVVASPQIGEARLLQEPVEGEDADAAGVEALAEAIIAAVPGEEGDEAGAPQGPTDESAPRRGGAADADDEHERLRVRHGSAGRCDHDPAQQRL